MKTNNSDIEEASDPDVTAEIQQMFEECILSYRESMEACYAHCWRCRHAHLSRGYVRCDKYRDDIDSCAPYCEKCR